jgi:hypothetical protein
MLRRLFGLGICTGAFALVFACVGSDPEPVAGTTPDGSATDANNNPTPATDSGKKDEDAPTCSLEQCGTSCVDVSSSTEHCGACDHGCGGGTCKDGHCGPVLVADHIAQPLGVAAAAGQVFWLRPGAVERCAATGCPDAAVTITDDVTINSSQPAGTTIVSDGNQVAWIAVGNASGNGLDLYTCPSGGCGGSVPHPSPGFGSAPAQVALNGSTILVPQMLGGSRVGPIGPGQLAGAGFGNDQSTGAALDATYLFIGGGGTLADVYRCKRVTDGGLCTDKTQLFQNPATSTVRLAAGGGSVFATSADGIKQCALPSCGGAATVIAGEDKAAAAIAADDAFVAWVNPDTGTVRACALPKCEGGPRTIADGQDHPISVAISGGFVYWANLGADAGAGTGSVWRAAL